MPPSPKSLAASSGASVGGGAGLASSWSESGGKGDWSSRRPIIGRNGAALRRVREAQARGFFPGAGELARVSGIGEELAQVVYDYFRQS